MIEKGWIGMDGNIFIEKRERSWIEVDLIEKLDGKKLDEDKFDRSKL